LKDFVDEPGLQKAVHEFFFLSIDYEE